MPKIIVFFCVVVRLNWSLATVLFIFSLVFVLLFFYHLNCLHSTRFVGCRKSLFVLIRHLKPIFLHSRRFVGCRKSLFVLIVLVSTPTNFGANVTKFITMSYPQTKTEINEFIRKYIASTQVCQIIYHCDICGERQANWVFRIRTPTFKRTCHHNINDEIARDCGKHESKSNESKSNESKSNESKTMREYTTWDMQYEYSTHWEEDRIGGNVRRFINKMNIKPHKISSAELNHHKQQLRSRYTFEKNLIKIKTRILKARKVDEVNTWILEGGLRDITFSLSVIEYWEKLHKFGKYQQNPTLKIFVDCYACGMKCYLPTQCEEAYITPYASMYTHLIESINKPKTDFFICGLCIHKCIAVAGEAYDRRQGKTVIHKCVWQNVKPSGKILFALGHLDAAKLPVYLAWYDIGGTKWKYGKLTGISDYNSCVLSVQMGDEEIFISLLSMQNTQFFLFQRPSSTVSPLYQGNNIFGELLAESKFRINDTLPEDQLKKYFDHKLMYFPHKQTMCLEWKVPIIRNGGASEALFWNVMHSKRLYDYLMEQQHLQYDDKQTGHKSSNYRPQICYTLGTKQMI